MADVGFNFTFDYRKLERELEGISKTALPNAAAGFLSGIAFEARRLLIKHNAEAFDGHVPYTDRGWYVEKARPNDRENMQSVVKALPEQAAYLKFQIFGGVRKKGDSGSGPFDLFVFADRKNAAGNLRRDVTQRLSKRNKREKETRAKVKAQKLAAIAARAAGKRKKIVSWVEKSKNKPGIFFGQVGGVKGYFERPERTLAIGPRTRGVVSVQTKGKPKPLLSVADQAKYKPRYNYDLQLSTALSSLGTQSQFQFELNRQLAKAKK